MPLKVTDERMLELIDILKDAGIVRFKVDFYNTLGIMRQNVREIQKGIRSFTPEQIRIACVTYNIDANWVFGITDTVFRKVKDKPKREDLQLF